MKRLIEAALFVSTDSLSLEDLCKLTELESEKEVKEIVKSLQEDYEDRECSIEIKEIGRDRYTMQVREELRDDISNLMIPVISREVLETLSLIALKQPITQANIVKSRGYCAYVHIKELENKNFISTIPQGRTKLIVTAPKFSEYFNIPSDIAETEDVKAIPNFLTERLMGEE